MKPLLSVIIITYNEAHQIENCLKSVDWADEIIVVDSGSTDETRTLCQRYTDKIFVKDWLGYGKQKNYALSQASGEWILSLDADEQVTPGLAAELMAALQTPYAAYAIPFQSYFLGKLIRYGDWLGEKHVRLFRRQDAHFTEDALHENVSVPGRIGVLKNAMTHHPYHDWHELQEKIKRYAITGAQLRYQQGKTAGVTTACLHGSWAFLRGYLLRAGFLDGKAGWQLAVSIAQYTYLRYATLRQLLLQS